MLAIANAFANATAVLFGHHLYMVALLTPLRSEIRSTDALRRSSSCISSITAAGTAVAA